MKKLRVFTQPMRSFSGRPRETPVSSEIPCSCVHEPWGALLVGQSSDTILWFSSSRDTRQKIRLVKITETGVYQRGVQDSLLTWRAERRVGIVTCSLSLRVFVGVGLHTPDIATICVTSHMLPSLFVSSATNHIWYKNLLPPKFLVRIKWDTV